MGKVVVIEKLTLDGVMQGPGGAEEDTRDGFTHGGWEWKHDAPEMDAASLKAMGPGWGLLLGRYTYGIWEKFWPFQPDDGSYATAFNAAPKFVASRTLSEPLSWRGTELLKGDAAEAVAALKGRFAGNLVVYGSGELVRTLLAADLVDELIVEIHPIILGQGRRLFGTTGHHLASFELVETVNSASGVIVARYVLAGGQ